MRRPAYFGCCTVPPRRTPDLDAIVKEYEIDRRLQRRRSAIVLGVEEFGVGQRHVTDLAFAFDVGAAEIGKPGAAKFGDPLQRLAPRLEHRMDEMHAAAFVGEDVSDKQPLIDFATLFGALLHERALGVDLFAARQQRRMPVRDGGDQLGDAQVARTAAGHLVVEGCGMTAEEPLLYGAGRGLQSIPFGRLVRFCERNAASTAPKYWLAASASRDNAPPNCGSAGADEASRTAACCTETSHLAVTGT